MTTNTTHNSDRDERFIVRQSKPRTVIDTWSTEYIHPKHWGTFKDFLKARTPSWDSRYTPEEKELKDRRKFGKCVGCGKKFADRDLIYFTQSVYKNGKCIGNLFSCGSCEERYRTQIQDKLNSLKG